MIVEDINKYLGYNAMTSGMHCLTTMRESGVLRTGRPDVVPKPKRCNLATERVHLQLGLPADVGLRNDRGDVVPTGCSCTCNLADDNKAVVGLANGSIESERASVGVHYFCQHDSYCRHLLVEPSPRWKAGPATRSLGRLAGCAA